MRTLFLSIVMILAGTSSWALNKNPLMRACRIEGGQFWVLNTDNDDMALCFFGSSAVGAQALLSFKSGLGLAQSLQAYKNSAATSLNTVCADNGAVQVLGGDTEGHHFQICRFPDQSLIEAGTLWYGPYSSENEGLDRALEHTY